MMDDIKRELHELGGEDFEEQEITEQRERIKNALQFDKFTPSEKPKNPCETNHRYENPAVDAYCERLSWENGWRPVDKTAVLSAYPEYVPTDEAVETIMKYDSILEIGAGAGYWAYVLENAGCNILPTDMLPKDVDAPEDREFWENVGTGKNNFISLERSGPHSINAAEWSEDISRDELPNIPWCTVEIADHSVIESYPEHTIMSCHPPAEQWTEEMLESIQPGQKFIFIGEWYPGPDGMPMFFKELTRWNLLDTFKVYDWGSMHAYGLVFEKETK